jgi:anthranilate/para-aminobenzoate synthase component I
MAVAAESELKLEPSLEQARDLAAQGNVVPVCTRLLDDCETPVSAFLKLRAGEPEGAPCFLLESAEQGQVGRYSFVGFRPRSVLRWSDGVLSSSEGGSIDAPDPYAGLPSTWLVSRSPLSKACRRLPVAPSASSATTWFARSSRSASQTPTRSDCPTWR